MFINVAIIFGLIKFAQILISFATFIYRQFIRQRFQDPARLYKQYGGKHTWAVVTGGSDGIGLNMCYELAS